MSGGCQNWPTAYQAETYSRRINRQVFDHMTHHVVKELDISWGVNRFSLLICRTTLTPSWHMPLSSWLFILPADVNYLTTSLLPFRATYFPIPDGILFFARLFAMAGLALRFQGWRSNTVLHQLRVYHAKFSGDTFFLRQIYRRWKTICVNTYYKKLFYNEPDAGITFFLRESNLLKDLIDWTMTFKIFKQLKDFGLKKVDL